MRSIALLLGAALVAAVGAAVTHKGRFAAGEQSPGPIWPQKGYDATHHARSPFQGPSRSPYLAAEWFSSTGAAFSDYPVITEDGTVVAVDDDGTVWCVSFANGTPEIKCQVESSDPGKPRGSPALIGHQIIAPLPNGQLDVIDAVTGDRLTQFSIPGAPDGKDTGDIVVPAISSDVEVIITWVGNTVFMFIWPDGGEPGTPAWTSNLAQGNINGLAVGQAVNHDPLAFATSSDGNIYAHDLLDGSAAWDQPCNIGVDIVEAPAIARDGLHLFLSVEGHGLYKIDALTGVVVWNKPVDITGAASFVIGQDGHLLAGDNQGNFNSFDPDTGTSTWQAAFKADEAVTSPAVVDGGAFVYFSDRGGTAYCLDATDGSLQWKLSTNATALGGIAIDIDHALYAVAENGMFVRIRGNTPRVLLPKYNIESKAQWPQRGGMPQHSGNSKFTGPTGVKSAADLYFAWVFKTKGEVVVGAVVAEDGTVIIPDDLGDVYAIDGQTGQQKWLYHLATGFVSGTPAIDPGSQYVFVATSEGRLMALNLQDGTSLWETDLPEAFLGSITVTYGNRVYVSCEDKNVYGFDGATGKQMLKVSTGSTEDDFAPAILYDDETLLVGSEDGFVRSYDHTTQSLRWRYQTHGPVLDVPCVQRTYGNIFIGAASEIIAVDANYGDRLWEQPSLNIAGNSPGCGNKHGLMFAGGTDRALHAVEEATGTERWTYYMPDTIYANPILDKWQDTLYVACMDGNLYALEAASGNLIWKKFVGKALRGDPILVDGNRIVVTSEGDDAVYMLAKVAPSPSPPPPSPPDEAAGDAGVVVAVLLVVGVVGYVGGGFGYSYVRTGEVRHVHGAFWSGVGQRISSAWQGMVQSTFRRSVPTGYSASSSFATSASTPGGAAFPSASAATSGFQAAPTQPSASSGFGSGSSGAVGGSVPAVGSGGGYGAL